MTTILIWVPNFSKITHRITVSESNIKDTLDRFHNKGIGACIISIPKGTVCIGGRFFF